MKVNVDHPLTKADIKGLRRWEIAEVVVAVCGVAALLVGFMCNSIGNPQMGATAVLTAFSCIILFLAISSKADVWPDDTGVLPKRRCAELLQVFKAWPEVEPYRQAVLQEGREFVAGEIEALKVEGQRIRQEQADRQKCQALYLA